VRAKAVGARTARVRPRIQIDRLTAARVRPMEPRVKVTA
jgi:hypothetical protein